MSTTHSSLNTHLLTFTFGTIVGGIAFAYATKAIPNMMSGMMQKMMSDMGGEGCNPADI